MKNRRRALLSFLVTLLLWRDGLVMCLLDQHHGGGYRVSHDGISPSQNAQARSLYALNKF